MEMTQLYSLATRLTGLACPKCASTSIRKHGHCNSIQRYRCKDCGRTFVETVNTPLHWIHHKLKMSRYIWTMSNGYSIRAAAVHLEICKDTSFSWRHKILASLRTEDLVPSSAPVGVCEIKLPHSFKGKRYINKKNMPDTNSLIIADARGIPCLQLLEKKNRVSESAKLLVNNTLQSTQIAVSKSNILTRAKRKIERIEIKHAGSEKLIVSQVSKTVKDLKLWMEKFHGVATKYLQQYWNWYRIESNTASLERFTVECLGKRQLQHYRQLIVI